MIKNVIFDIGNVLLEFKPLEYLRSQINSDDLVQTLFNTIFSSKEWIELDRGTLTNEDAVKIFCDRTPHCSKHINDVMNRWTDLLLPIEDSIKALCRLKEEGYNIYLLSNFHDMAFEIVYNKYDFFKMADGMIISSRVKMIKPDAEIYNTILKKYNLVPEETIFIDDSLPNIEAAQKLNIRTVHFINNINLMDKLKEIIKSA